MYQNTISCLQSLHVCVCVCSSLFCCMLLYLDPKVETLSFSVAKIPWTLIGKILWRALRFAWGRCYRIQHDPVHTQSGSREYGLHKIICKMFMLMLVVDGVSHLELGLHSVQGYTMTQNAHGCLLAKHSTVMLMKVHRILLFFLSG